MGRRQTGRNMGIRGELPSVPKKVRMPPKVLRYFQRNLILAGPTCQVLLIQLFLSSLLRLLGGRPTGRIRKALDPTRSGNFPQVSTKQVRFVTFSKNKHAFLDPRGWSFFPRRFLRETPSFPRSPTPNSASFLRETIGTCP